MVIGGSPAVTGEYCRDLEAGVWWCVMLSREEVLRIAKLARLSLCDEEVTEFQSRLTKVLDHMKDLDTLSLSRAEFPKHIPQDALKLREDARSQWSNRDALLKNAPVAKDNHFGIPIVVEKES